MRIISKLVLLKAILRNILKIAFGIEFMVFVLLSMDVKSQTIVSGYISDSLSSEPIIGASISSKKAFSFTNNYGYFSLTIDLLSDSLSVSSIGFQSRKVAPANYTGDGIFRLSLIPQTTMLDVVMVSEKKIGSKETGQVYISAKEIKQTPTLFGEKDAIKAIQYLPGVQKGIEGSTSFYVRGGGAGENLLQLDEATVYNANHLFGFFSVFNADAINGLNFYKGSFPAIYGGRLSSVSDIRMKDGNSKEFKAEGGISIISSRLTLQGPIIKDKLSFLISARRTYLDPLLKVFQSTSDETLYNFYDLNGKIKWTANPKNTFYLSSYLGNDALTNSTEDQREDECSTSISAFKWGNRTLTTRWNHLYGQRLFSNTSLIQTVYHSERSNRSDDIIGEIKNHNLNSFNSRIKETTLKIDFDYYLNAKSALTYGFWYSHYQFVPREIILQNTRSSQDIKNKIQSKNASTGGYASIKNQIGDHLQSQIGIRQVLFKTETKTFIKTEPRLRFSLDLMKNSQISLSYSRMNQFINQVQSTGLGIPTDLWFPTDSDFNPQQSDQISLGYSRPIKENYELKVEAYVKKMKNILAYQEGAGIFATGEQDAEFKLPDIVASGDGISGGLELLLKKSTGKLNGWLSGTVSRTVYRFPLLNEGKPFFPVQDRRFDITLVSNYTFNKKTRLSAVWFYTSGNVLAAPIGVTEMYHFYEQIFPTFVAAYGNRNAYRSDPFHRLDVTLSRTKEKKKYTQTWEFGIYNAYFRKNPLYYSLQSENKPGGSIITLKRIYLLPVIPFVSYNFTI